LNLSGANFYSWDSSRRYLPEIWDAIRDYSWSETPQDISARLIGALNTHDPEQLVPLYAPAAVHITSERTIQGHSALRAWYRSMFDELLPSARFILTGYTGEGNSRHLSWTATSNTGRVLNGKDTLGVSNGVVVFHYSFFSIVP
jgi:hypothetical protein